MKTVGKTIAFAALATLIGCGGSGNESLFGFTSLRVVNASSNATVTAVRYAGDSLSGDLLYGESAPAATSNPLSYDSGSGNISFSIQSSTTSSLSSSLNLVADHYVTTVLAGLVGDTGGDSLRIIHVDTDPANVATSSANLRILHAAPALPSTVDIYAISTSDDLDSTSPTVAGASKYTPTSVLVRTEGDTRIVVTAEDSKTPLIDVTENFTAGNLYTVIVRNNNDATGGVVDLFTAPL